MLVEGGYLHSMKQLIEKSADMSDSEIPKKESGFTLVRWAKRTPLAMLIPLQRVATRRRKPSGNETHGQSSRIILPGGSDQG